MAPPSLGPLVGRVLSAALSRGGAARRNYSHGLEHLRSLLTDEVSTAVRSPNGESGPSHASLGERAGGSHDNSVVKELLRVFTRKVPGGLVPDELTQGFMQAYRGLGGPQERLAFFQLLYDEMGLKVGEVRSAVALWDTALLRAAATPTPAPGPTPAPTHPAAAPPAGAARGCAASVEGVGPGSPPPPPPHRLGMGSPHDGALYRAADRLGSATRPLYTMLFVPVSQAPDGMKFLVDMRADLLRLAGQQAEPALAAPLRAMADHLRQSLSEWFSVGLLHLQPISWRESPAALLECVMRAEAVHPLDSWEELRRRLGPRRRVFAFTHPSMPGEPLVVLHTALLDRPASAMSQILGDPHSAAAPSASPHRPATAAGPAAAGRYDPAAPPYGNPPPPPSSPSTAPPTAAVFYSISASQPGLRGIELGHFLIKRVAERLLAENPSIRTLVTLSPLPNFRAWLTSRLRQEQQLPSASSIPAPGSRPRGADEGAAAGVGVDELLLHPQEREHVVLLARSLGWGGPGGESVIPAAGGKAAAGQSGHAGGAATSDPASGAAASAAALGWLLEEDRWLRLLDGGDPRGGGAGGGGGGGPAGLGGGAGGGTGGSGPGDGVAQAGSAGDRGAGGAEVFLQRLLMRLAARYLAVEKRRSFALCPVAHFHLRNGASLWRLNWRADMSALGLGRSCGIMVNYQYDLAAVYDNNRRYLLQHEVQAHTTVQQLLRGDDHADSGSA